MKATLALFVVLVAPASALAQAPAGIITTLDGLATVTRRSQATPMPLRFSDSVFIGDRIATSPQSLLKALIGGKALLTIREVSTVGLYETLGRATIALESGKLMLSVLKDRMAPGEVWEIRTRNAVVEVRGTQVIVEVVSPVVTTICVMFGTVSVGAVGGAAVDVGPSQSVTVTGDAPGGKLSPLSSCRTGVSRGCKAEPRRVRARSPERWVRSPSNRRRSGLRAVLSGTASAPRGIIKRLRR